MKGAGDDDFLVLGEAVSAILDTESWRTGGDLSMDMEYEFFYFLRGKFSLVTSWYPLRLNRKSLNSS